MRVDTGSMTWQLVAAAIRAEREAALQALLTQGLPAPETEAARGVLASLARIEGALTRERDELTQPHIATTYN